jgi:hypothetical protein
MEIGPARMKIQDLAKYMGPTPKSVSALATVVRHALTTGGLLGTTHGKFCFKRCLPLVSMWKSLTFFYSLSKVTPKMHALSPRQISGIQVPRSEMIRATQRRLVVDDSHVSTT